MLQETDTKTAADSICGIYADSEGGLFLCMADASGGRSCVSTRFEPFAWLCERADVSKYACNTRGMKGPASAPLDTLAQFANPAVLEKFFKERDKSLPIERVIGIENQYLMANRARMFASVPFDRLRRMQLDIEVYSERGFPRAEIDADRIIAVGLSGEGGQKILEIDEMSAKAEKELLEKLRREILRRDPDIIEGHNIYKFDLQYIRERCAKVGASMDWGRFGAPVKFRQSRLSIAERTLAYPRCDIPGRTVVDTMHLVQFYDLNAREMESYSLKYAAVHFGISDENERTYIRGDLIKDAFFNDRRAFCAYLSDDLRETAGIAERLLPTYLAQVQNFPLTLQDCILRGSGTKVESVFLEKYLHADAALPIPGDGGYFEGALSQSYELGVFRNVLHYDVASLYPSLLLSIGKCPANDHLKIFLSSLAKLREYRLEYKRKARECGDPKLKREYQARQQSFKILINSFYGYLGLRGAIFADTQLAEEVTRRGRELLKRLMEAFGQAGCKILEADTDGLYVCAPKYFDAPEKLLEKVGSVLPEGVDLEFDGKYRAMLCYKAKNYALLEDDKIVLRGSSFRSRSTEPIFRSLTHCLIKALLEGDTSEIAEKIAETEQRIRSGKAGISELARCEFIGKSCQQYESEIKRNARVRRAAMEAALLMNPKPEIGDRVCYYIAAGAAAKTADWKRARPAEGSGLEPYDANYYLSKLDDWRKKYSDIAPFLAEKKDSQAEFEF